MAYDEFLADRIRHILKTKSVTLVERKMMGGLCFMINDKMCCGLLTDKITETAVLMARIGDAHYDKALENPFCSEMNFTGRTMKGFVFISAEGIDTDEDLENWIQMCLDFNPLAKSSKKTNKHRV